MNGTHVSKKCEYPLLSFNNLCTYLDLQEHGLFALRNILHKNPENQAVVDALKRIDEQGSPRSSS